MTDTIKPSNGYKPDWENVRYGTLEELKELLLLIGEIHFPVVEA